MKKISNDDEYYELMCDMSSKDGFRELHKKWFKCFSHILLSFKVNHNKETIKSLFYDFDMDNWKAMHKENSEFKDYSNKELLDAFVGECSYICDIASYDRLFRAHWIFKEVFVEELLKIKYPLLYK